jgi:hypothetical protein
VDILLKTNSNMARHIKSIHHKVDHDIIPTPMPFRHHLIIHNMMPINITFRQLIMEQKLNQIQCKNRQAVELTKIDFLIKSN